MSEKRILIASLLKPINDTRMFEKIGLSLSCISDTQINIAGFRAHVPQKAPANVHFHPIFDFKRLSIARLKAQQKYEKLLFQLKPDLIIACTHELLLASQAYCRKYGAQLMYDVQENYTLNLTSQRNYPPLLRQLLAYRVGKAEQKAAPDIAHFLLAEHSYAQELPFLAAGKYSVVANKYKPATGYTLPATPVRLDKQPLRLLYSGTIAEVYGIFEAVSLAEALHCLEPSTTLTIVGYSSRSHTLRQLQQCIKGKSFIRLIGGDRLVPHQQILQSIKESNVGLLPYKPHPSTERCIPTKLYEYMAYALPVLVQQNPLWQSITEVNQAGISIDFNGVCPQEVLKRIRQELFYTSGISPDIFWKSEEIKLIAIVKEALTRFSKL
ncbi:glycosyltransferase [Pontibacter anaerobius]|uniref:Glycosyltransferase n=1 Tax=Pontibacter anaerobius TaxID=2993940 RepID=A0ABT3RIU7_9BACT|nr:glycosyltransferase [Pontibacter anaerobius]MCX2741480.1 glycosyltransferase [Pontibacter anaerobius]